jgi:hypothetical protein
MKPVITFTIPASEYHRTRSKVIYEKVITDKRQKERRRHPKHKRKIDVDQVAD